jgi:GntR family transcriptional regulator
VSLRHLTSGDVKHRYHWSAGVYIGSVAWEDRQDRIDRDGPALVWQQIAEDIAADVESGTLPPGSRLPSEQALADDIYGVSRPTIRRAIAALVERGLLTVVHGRGTFVSPGHSQTS